MSNARDLEATYRPSSGERPRDRRDAPSIPTLTLLAHPDPERVGSVAHLPGLAAGQAAELSRVAPDFAYDGGAAMPLGDRAISRKALRIAPSANGWSLDAPADARCLVDGVALPPAQVLTAEALARGVVIEIAARIAALFHVRPALGPGGDAHGLIGTSPALARARSQIQAVAPVDAPVLVRGETGTGKELAARALHDASPRRAGPFVAVNLGALTPTLALAELFGHARGAFSGAVASREGLFAQADGGTLFLDEIGEAPTEIQVMLLRALETGMIQAVGASGPRRVDVRLVSATDASLEEAVAAGRFKAPLYHRLAGYEIFLPPLRERPEDIGLLLTRFLREELAPFGASGRLAAPDPGQPSWLATALVRRLTRYDWPGNVRQLKNVARQLAISGHAQAEAPIDAALERLLAEGHAPTRAREPRTSTRSEHAPLAPPPSAPSELDEESVRDALEANDFTLARAAAALGVARNTLNAFIARSGNFRRPRDLVAAEISQALTAAAGATTTAARALGVSERGLKLRMRDLGLEPRGG